MTEAEARGSAQLHHFISPKRRRMKKREGGPGQEQGRQLNLKLCSESISSSNSNTTPTTPHLLFTSHRITSHYIISVCLASPGLAWLFLFHFHPIPFYPPQEGREEKKGEGECDMSVRETVYKMKRETRKSNQISKMQELRTKFLSVSLQVFMHYIIKERLGTWEWREMCLLRCSFVYHHVISFHTV